ncbi:hypothetical protein [Propioniciclava soli]|uniref:hypothetical protein n=1 Tax=Propioniciclava soli TaxID=2775081 RepID=UPI001E3CBC8A|nr:hypothetical protein [Propioniciclava soli]
MDDFDLTNEIPTVQQWIIHSLTGTNHQTEAEITDTITAATNPTDAAVRHAIALLLAGSLAAAEPEQPTTRRPDLPHTPGSAEGAAAAMDTINANLDELRRISGLPPAPTPEAGSHPH